MIDQYEAPPIRKYSRGESLSSDRQLGIYGPLGKEEDLQRLGRLGRIEERNTTYANSRPQPDSLGAVIYRLFNLNERKGYDSSRRGVPRGSSQLEQTPPVSAKEAVSRLYQN